MSTSNNIDLNALLPYLISGGGGAVAGALATGRRKVRSGEGRLGYLGRILRNSLLAGGAAGGGHYLLNKGMKDLRSGGDSPTAELQRVLGLGPKAQASSGGDGSGNMLTGEPGDSNALVGWTRDLLRGKSGVGLGAAAYLATNRLPLIGSDHKNRKFWQDEIAKKLGTNSKSLMDANAGTVDDARVRYNNSVEGGKNDVNYITRKQRVMAGLGSERWTKKGLKLFDEYVPDSLKSRVDKGLWKGRISKYSRGNFVSSALGLGSTRPRQVGRLGLLAGLMFAAPKLLEHYALPEPDITN